jgi:hypothetical protein
MVEIWFSILTKQQVRRGIYHDVPELIAAIEHFIDGYNDRVQPFVWTKTADQVLEPAHRDPGVLSGTGAGWAQRFASQVSKSVATMRSSCTPSASSEASHTIGGPMIAGSRSVVLISGDA